MKRLLIFDTTLRDGEQSPGYGMTSEQKLTMARQLDALGVDVIEAGFPAASPEDLAGVQAIARELEHSAVATLARCSEKDIEACARGLEQAAKGRIHIFLSTSDLHLEHKLGIDRKTALGKIVMATKLARKYASDVEFSPEDATRTDHDYLIEAVQAAVDEGATVINLPDTVGYSTPAEYRAMFELVRARVRGIDQVTLSAHCHNDLGLAVANSLAALEGGATQIECTINGIGERAGNASLEEIIMALHVRSSVFPYETNIQTKLIYPTSQLLSALTGVGVQPNKAVVGRNAFAHESGVHQHGVIKDRRTYEIMTPESVGAPPSRLVLGRHSGRHAVAARLADLGYPVAGTTLNLVYDRFLRACESGTALADDDLIQIALDNRPPPNPPYTIALVQAQAGTVRPANASVRLMREGQTYGATALGDGPVDAVCTCIDSITGHPARVVGYELRAISEGRDAEGEVSLRVIIDERVFSGRAVGADIVEASARAYLSAVNKCLATRREIKPPQVPPATLPPKEMFAGARP
ncbi:MAG TPA: 2-isopropylmalate synthase [Polyangiaceae bacterium]|nr:2-isopropylmalate synthase [Polyangiaceae bacterium]